MGANGMCSYLTAEVSAGICDAAFMYLFDLLSVLVRTRTYALVCCMI